jgi:DNA replicative helicase MCM subunit Mcm2 (Cdc46/Mcm family)
MAINKMITIEGIITAITETKAPKKPATFVPTKTALFTAIKPGRD